MATAAVPTRLLTEPLAVTASAPRNTLVTSDMMYDSERMCTYEHVSPHASSSCSSARPAGGQRCEPARVSEPHAATLSAVASDISMARYREHAALLH
eukprot:7283314-Pyramimonas_sp.AAC.1